MLLEGLLVKDPKRRLGSLGGIREILGHPWVRKIKPSDIANRVIETPIKIDLLAFNVNEEEIEEAENNFEEKFHDESNDFKEMFEGFYFNRHDAINVLDEALPSVKSDSTKENKSLNQKLKNRECEKQSHKSQSKEKMGDKYNITFKPEELTQKGYSELRTLKSKKALRKNKSKRQL